MKKILWLIVVMMFLSTFGTLTTALAASPLKELSYDLIGTRYKYGGNSAKTGFDCSGFISYVYKKFGVKLPRSSRSMATVGKKVARKDIKPGDLLFFYTSGGKRISHVGVYLGGGYFIHASSSRGVAKNHIDEKYYKKRYSTARRILTSAQQAKIMGDGKVTAKASTKSKKSVTTASAKKKSTSSVKIASAKNAKTVKSSSTAAKKSSAKKVVAKKTPTKKATTKKATTKKATTKKATTAKSSTKKPTTTKKSKTVAAKN